MVGGQPGENQFLVYLITKIIKLISTNRSKELVNMFVDDIQPPLQKHKLRLIF